jgi:SAM-dependent methyltransferase
MSNNKIVDKKKIKKFFLERANKHDNKNPLKSVIYQDKNPKLAKERDNFEKKRIQKILNISKDDTILDVGCGIGRWAESFSEVAKNYVGVDYIDDFIKIANLKYIDKDNLHFICLEGSELSNSKVKSYSPYTVFMILGLHPYIDDEECYDIFKKLIALSAENSQIIIREPIGVEKEIVLDNVWSEDMETYYTAKYRTHNWFIKMFNDIIYPKGFKLNLDEALYPDHLNNRIETKQHLFCLKK